MMWSGPEPIDMCLECGSIEHETEDHSNPFNEWLERIPLSEMLGRDWPWKKMCN